MTKNTEAAETTATPCECSKYDALVNAQLTDDNLANGDYDVFTTGCQATTKREFAPGHDAKLKSFLIRYSGPEFDVRRNEGGVATSSDAQGHANRYEFGYMVAEGIARKGEKDAAKAKRQAEKEARKAAKGKTSERKLAEGAGVVKPLAEVVADEEAAHAEAEKAKVAEREQSADWDDVQDIAQVETDLDTLAREEREHDLVKAKVGRWTYEGIVNEDGSFTYAAKLGGGSKTVPAGKFQLV